MKILKAVISIDATGLHAMSSLLVKSIIAAGKCDMTGLRVDNDLSIDGSAFSEMLEMNRCRISGGLFITSSTFSGGFLAHFLTANNGAKLSRILVKKQFRAARSSIGSDLEIRNSAFRLKSPIDLKQIKIDGTLSMERCAIGAGVNFSQSRISSDFVLNKMAIFRRKRYAIEADRLVVGGVFAIRQSVVRGQGSINNSSFLSLELTGSRFGGVGSFSILALGIAVKEFANCRRSIFRGGLRISSSKINGELNLKDAVLESAYSSESTGRYRRDGQPQFLDFATYALSLSHSEIETIVMPQDSQHRPRGIIDFSNCECEMLEDVSDNWPYPPLAVDHIKIDDFKYRSFRYPEGKKWLVDQVQSSRSNCNRIIWLKCQDPNRAASAFVPQPWKQAASALQLAGLHRSAQAVFVEAEREKRRSGSLGIWFGLLNRFLDYSCKFGYEPWRAIVACTFAILTFSVLWMSAYSMCQNPSCSDGGVFVRTSSGNFVFPIASPGTANVSEKRVDYPSFSPLAYSFDLFVPLIDFGYRASWQPNPDFKILKTIYVPKWSALVSCSVNAKDCFSNFDSPDNWIGVSLTAGGVFYGLYIIEMFVGLVMTSIAVGGFAGVIRPSI